MPSVVGRMTKGAAFDSLVDAVDVGNVDTMTEKGTPVNADLLILADSADSNNRKKLQIGNIPTQTHTHTESDITDLAHTTNHTALTNIGTNTHAQVDTHIAAANPHSGSGTLSNVVEDATPELGGELDAGAHTIGFTQQTATGDGATTIDWTLGNKFKFTFGAFNETFTFTAPTNPCNILLMLVQDGTGSRTATWPASVKWPSGTAPTLSTAASAIDIVSMYFDGTNYYAQSGLDFS